MSVTDQSYERYRTARSSYEWMMRVGDPRTAPVLFVPPLFEELNRTRALIVAVMRALALEGHGSWLPDLSGTSESVVALEEVTWEYWRADVTAASRHVAEASERAPLVVGIRGGCLLDDAAEGDCRWRFAPAKGSALARDLERASLGGGAEWAGYHGASPGLRQSLAAASPVPAAPLRTARLTTDGGEADVKIEGPALWRRSEPGNSADLAAALAKDIREWRRNCDAS